MNKTIRSLSALTKHISLCALMLLLTLVVGCAEVTPEDSGNSTWVSASAEVERSLGVSTWHVEALEGGATRILGFDRSDRKLSELRISAHVFNQAEALMYELHVTRYSRLVMTESGVIENTLSSEPRGDEWFNAMVAMQSATNGSSVNKSLLGCVGREAGVEAACIINDWANGSWGHPADYFKVCMAVYQCAQEHRASNYQDNYLASNSTSGSGYGYGNSGYSSYGDSYNNGYSSYGDSYNNGYSSYGDSYNNGSSSYGNSYDSGYSNYGDSYDSGYYGSNDDSGWYSEW